MWQDIVLMIMNLLFGLMLLPQLIDIVTHGKHMNLWTCGFTFIGLCVVNITMATLELWLSAMPICTIIWGLLLYFSWKNKKR